jgi:hypothetical protein
MTREEARKGVVTGPTLGVSSRHMHSFAESQFNSDLDLLRELGAILLVAQERSREDRTEKVPGEGQWWAEKPRFGGLPYEVPGEYQLATAAAEKNDENKDNATEDQSGTANGKKEKARDGGVRRRKKEGLPSDMTLRQRAIHAYKEGTPPPSTWDPKALYNRMGKHPDSTHDEVSEA